MAHVNKTQMMSRAWAMHRNTRNDMSACMREAWDLSRLSDAMRRGVVHLVYRKKDGTIRKALATLNVGSGAFVAGSSRKESPKVVTYWDLERCDWRCFKCENLLNWY